MLNNAQSGSNVALLLATEQGINAKTPYQLSDVRTGPPLKRKRSDSQSLIARNAPTMGIHGIERYGKQQTCDFLSVFDDFACSNTSCEPSEVCVDCVVDCQDADCQAGPEGQCTDPCMSVPCPEGTTCVDVCTKEACETTPCDAGDACLKLMDDNVSHSQICGCGSFKRAYSQTTDEARMLFCIP